MDKNMNSMSQKMRALVVEDSLVTQRLLSMLLTRVNFEVDFVENGLEAIKQTRGTQYDIIFLDVMMPVMDGYQVCKVLKANKETRGIPVVMLTSRDGMFDKVRGKMAGTDVYLTKPIQHGDLVGAVSKFFPLRNGSIDLQEEPVETRPPSSSNESKQPVSQQGLESKLRQREEYLERTKVRGIMKKSRKLSRTDGVDKVTSISERLRRSRLKNTN